MVKKLKKLSCYAMVAVMLLNFNAPATSAAEKEPVEISNASEVSDEIISDVVEDWDSDEVLSSYLDSEFSGKVTLPSYYSSALNGSKLTGVNLAVYNSAKAQIEKIASGEKTGTKIYVSASELGYEGVYWSAADLGVDAIYDTTSDEICSDAVDALRTKLDYDYRKVIYSLLRDCPYEMYWFGNRYSVNNVPLTASYKDGEYKLSIGGSIYLGLQVANDYKGADEFTVNAEKITAVNNAIANAKQIVTDAKYKSDYNKLNYYMEQLCDLNTYNHDAASDDYTGGYGDPWQVIYMFDGDSTTNVVCEGYSKSFQYLCDMTSFNNSDIYCYTVTGDMYYTGGGGGHMWNIIHMDDGKQYMVDVTNCDGSTINKRLFIGKMDSGDTDSGYIFERSGGSALKYVYDAETKKIYRDSELTLASAEYSVPAEEPLSLSVEYPEVINCGEEITFTLNGLNGSGNYKYYLNSVSLDISKQCTAFEKEVVDPGAMSRIGYTTDNTFKFTFYASGTYTFKYYVMDAGTTPIKYYRKIVVITINDPDYPTVEEIVDSIVAECEAAGCTSDYDKALWLHDWLVNNMEYDYSMTYCGVEGALARGKGICESYHGAYTMLLREMGIETGRMTGNGHVWTAAKLDGKWYQIDVTWDDNGYSAPGSYEQYLYFGLTDEIMSMVHSDHSAVEGYESTSLDNNYFIKSSKITEWSDEFVETINANITNKVYNFSMDVTKNIPASYKNVMYNLVAYKLSNSDWGDVELDVSYNSTDSKLEVEITQKHDHNVVTDAAVAATCTGTGLTEGSHCSICGKVIVAQTVVPAKGHTAVTDAAVAATCTGTGLTEGSHCSTCGMVLKDRKTIAVLSHDWKQVSVSYSGQNKTTTYKCSLGCNQYKTVTEKLPYTIGWKSVGNKWKYVNTSGAFVTGWTLIDGKWYLFDKSNIMLTGWKLNGGKWYYLESSGAMATGWKQIGGKWYYLESSGAMATGWKQISGKWYYLESSGAMATGWKQVGGKWYYLESSGAMATGWKKLSGKWYYLESCGAMVTGWKKIGNTWYYFTGSGSMVTGTQKINGKKYIFSSSGAWIK